MPKADNNGTLIEYETFGNPAHPAVLLVNGFTSQMTNMEVGFCELLAAAGRFVIRYDNRDVGKSTWFDGVAPPPTREIMAARKGEGPMPLAPYSLVDMAADGMNVLDAIGIDSAHIAGVSMGGMLVQTMAIHFPQRVRSMVSIMSHTGEPEFGRSSPEAGAALMSVGPSDREGYVANSVESRRIWSSPRYFDREVEAARLGRDYDPRLSPRRGTSPIRCDHDGSTACRSATRADDTHLGDSWTSRHTDHAVGGRRDRRTDSGRLPPRAQRYGPRFARSPLARTHGRNARTTTQNRVAALRLGPLLDDRIGGKPPSQLR